MPDPIKPDRENHGETLRHRVRTIMENHGAQLIREVQIPETTSRKERVENLIENIQWWNLGGRGNAMVHFYQKNNGVSVYLEAGGNTWDGVEAAVAAFSKL